MTRRKRTSHRLRWALGLIGVVAVLLVGFTGYQALRAKAALEGAASDFDTLSGQLTSGDAAGARPTLESAQEHARVALANTRGPLWWLSTKLPGLGPNVEAVRTVAGVTDGLASDVLPDVVTAAGVLRPENLRPVKGRVQLQPIRRVQEPVVRAAEALSAQSREVGEIDTSTLVSSIAGPIAELQSKIADADVLAERASRAVRLLPAMLGADGRRDYLFLFQNNAEIRATGGIPGAFAIISARDGRITLGRQFSAGDLGPFERPPVPLTRQERALFGLHLGTLPQDTNFTPDFPRTAQILAGMWKAQEGSSLDGVMSTDPVALSYLLRGTGPVKTAGGRTLSADSVVRLLLNQTYTDIPDPEQQNDFFAAAARSVFDAVSAGTGDPRAVLDGLTQAAAERRILVWSAHRDEQQILEPTALAGGLASEASTAPDVGVYFNAARPYKLDYYLDYEASVRSTGCVGGRQRLSVTLELSSRLTRDTPLNASLAPEFDFFGQRSIVVNAYAFAPVGGDLTSFVVDGEKATVDLKKLDGRRVMVRTFIIRPGQERSVTMTMVSGPGQTGDPQLRVTPGVRTSGIGTVGASACP